MCWSEGLTNVNTATHLIIGVGATATRIGGKRCYVTTKTVLGRAIWWVEKQNFVLTVLLLKIRK